MIKNNQITNKISKMDSNNQYQIKVYCTIDKQYKGNPLEGEWFILSKYKSEKDFWTAVHKRFYNKNQQGYVFPVISHWMGPSGIASFISSNFIDQSLFDIYNKFTSDKLIHIFDNIKLYMNQEYFDYTIPFYDIEILKKWVNNHIGEYASKMDFIENYLGKVLPPIPKPLKIYFDKDAYIDSFFKDKYMFIDGHIFRI